MSVADDRTAIEDLYCRYFHLVDSGRAMDLPGEVFTEDAVIDYGNAGAAVGRQALLGSFENYAKSLEASSHHMTNVVINVEGDRAKGLCRIMAWLWFLDTKHLGPDRPADFLELAASADEFRREAGGWRFTRRSAYSLGPGGLGRGLGVAPPWPSDRALLRDAPWPF